MNLVKGKTNQFFIDVPNEDSAISLKGSYLDIDLIATCGAAGHDQNAEGNHKRFLNLVLFASFIEHRLTTSSGN